MDIGLWNPGVCVVGSDWPPEGSRKSCHMKSGIFVCSEFVLCKSEAAPKEDGAWKYFYVIRILFLNLFFKC